MAIDKSLIGTDLPITALTVDRGRLRFFAKSIGETNPIYTDIDAARCAGHPDLPAPPTFLFSVELENPDPFAFLKSIDVDLGRVLHGEQNFVYHRTVYPGDELMARPRITDVYTKKGGALEFLVKDTVITRDDQSTVAELRSVFIVQNDRLPA